MECYQYPPCYEPDCGNTTDDDGDELYQVYEDAYGCDDTLADTDGDLSLINI